MADQDAQDINQMMYGASNVNLAAPKKSMFLWIVLGCVVVGVGLGILVYQQSTKTAPVVKTTPRPTTVAAIPTPTSAGVEFVTAVANTMTFPKTGKLRVFTSVNNIQLVISIATTGGTTQTLTIPNKTIDAANPLTYADATFDVAAGSTATIKSFLNSATGPQNMGWILPTAANECGANQGAKISITPAITWAESHLVTGQTIFAKQCWADPGSRTVIEDNDFNDFVLLWSYASSTTTESSSPAASGTASAQPSSNPSNLPSSSVRASASPSARASAVASPTVRPSSSSLSGAATTPTPRAAMPDTTGGVPVTGVFEVTVGTVSAGLVLLVLGLFGLLAL